MIFPIDAPVVDADPLHAAAGNEEQAVLVADDRQSLFTATVNPASKVRPGSRLTLAVDSSRFHFFDVDERREPDRPATRSRLAGSRL